ncbi:hypothetical protein Asp14428_39920 [Actinoplanes sp. NBRC 14428]|nr:hypothetical protein Asp14428_39920 [Actinoplanes sp. NBRC 14428]
MSSKFYAVVLAVVAALALVVGASAGTAPTPGGAPDRVVAAVPPPDGPGGTCVSCV